MFDAPSPIRTLSRRAVIAVSMGAALLLAACNVTPSGTGGPRVGQTVNVALLVPYGSAAAGDDLLARNLEQSARMAAAEVTDITLNISVYQTAGDPATAASQAELAIREGTDIIVGPLRSDAAAAVSVAAGSRVNVLSFSNNAAIAGGNTFVLGNTFGNAAMRMVSYAASQGRSRILVVHAQNLAGEVARDGVLTALPFAGAELAGTVPYEFSAQGVVDVIPTIMETVRDTGANAIVLTSDTSGALPLFAQLLPENGLDTEAVQMIGLTRWDTPAQTLELSGLQGGWFALPDPAASAGFRTRYTSTYGEPPHVLAGLGYDAIQIISATARTAGQLGSDELSATSGVNGANGVFRLNTDGSNSRALAVAEIIDSQVIIRDPAAGLGPQTGF